MLFHGKVKDICLLLPVSFKILILANYIHSLLWVYPGRQYEGLQNVVHFAQHPCIKVCRMSSYMYMQYQTESLEPLQGDGVLQYQIKHSIMRWRTASCDGVLHYEMEYCIVRQSTASCDGVLHRVMEYCIVRWSTALCDGVLHCAMEYCFVWWTTALCDVVLHCVVEYCIVWWSTALCDGVLHCVMDYCIVFTL